VSSASAVRGLRDLVTPAAWALGLFCSAATADTMGVERLETWFDDGLYNVRFEATLDAPPARVLAVIRDFAAYPQLDHRVIEARVVGEDAGRPLLFTRLHGCVGVVFCRDMVRVERVTELPDGLVAEVIPARSDMPEGRSETRLRAAGSGTRLTYELHFRMSSWMPQWLVRRPILRELEDGTRSMFANVEARAREAGSP
jgi:hypothetical protein